jgi:hypothetical protein
MSEELEEKRPFSYMHIRALMLLSAAYGALMTAEATEMKFSRKEEAEAFPSKRRQELEDKLSEFLDDAWKKAKKDKDS